MDENNTRNADKGIENKSQGVSLRDLADASFNYSRFYAFGIDHHTASTAHQNTYVLSESTLRFLYQHIPLMPHTEYFILSTPGRTVCVLFGTLSYINVVRNYLIDTSGDLWHTGAFVLEDEAAISHIIKVTAGLDEVGNQSGQMLKKVKEASKIAYEEGTIRVLLHRLLHTAFRAAKKVTNEMNGTQNLSCKADKVACIACTERRENEESQRALCEEMTTDFLSWYFHYQAMQPALDTIAHTFEVIRNQEMGRNKKRFSEAAYQQVDTITQSIMQKVLGILVTHSKDTGPENVHYERCIELLQKLFTRDGREVTDVSTYNQSKLALDLISQNEDTNVSTFTLCPVKRESSRTTNQTPFNL